MHVLVISPGYRETLVIDLSIKEMIRVHEQPEVITNYRSILLLFIFESEYDNRFANFSWFPMHYTIHSDGVNSYRYVRLEI